MAGREHDEEHSLRRRRLALLRREWQLSLYPQAAEAGGCLVGVRSAEPTGRDADPERSRAEAIRRARAKVRRYGVANRLNRLATLTYAGEGCFDPVQLRQDVAAFFKALRPALGRERFPYVWVPEWHPGGHGLHVHFVVGRYVRQSLIREAWGHGIVHIKLIGDLPVGSGALAEARRAAGYLCKYIGKGLEDERRRAGLHRYEVAQGFQPERIYVYGETDSDAIARASEYMARAPETIWRSSSVEGWRGPPACWAAWP
ncbi:MAG: hypothetical protein OEW52_11045 [Thermoleophilia bacterium]|nr:hypothetical protein [Thermoleophilia bacterium]MDH5281668.1 hypothetical protein [Thermoleophilia bacterium]